MAKPPKMPKKGKGVLMIVLGGPGLPRPPKSGRTPKAPKLGT